MIIPSCTLDYHDILLLYSRCSNNKHIDIQQIEAIYLKIIL